MKTTVLFLILLLTVSFAFSQKHTFTAQGREFYLDGKQFVIRSGEMHYPRVPREYWRDRFKKAKAMGLNAITTYVFWNLHEPQPGKFDFSGNLDVAEFVREANEEGLFVIVRPGPYICTEWDFGGIPAWLLREKDMKVRTSDPRFLKASDAYIKKVGEQLAALQINHGGNILMTQVENEYGSFGEDREYMQAIRKSIVSAGFDGMLFTSDGANKSQLENGTLLGVNAVINFSANDNIAKEFEKFAAFRQRAPRMIGEYWVGWFDHWGDKHNTVAAKKVAEGVDYALSQGISFNLYMFHGGTSFGYMAGANNSSKEPYQPDVTSYDYDSPLDEAGRPTAKYYAVRDAIKKHLPAGETLPEISDATKFIEIPTFTLNESAVLKDLLKNPIKSPAPQGMEELGQNYGFVLYRRKFDANASGKLEAENLRDYANVYADNKSIGMIDRRLKQNSIDVSLAKGATLDLLVENMGRLNFGKTFIYDRKGMFGRVSLNGAELSNWEMYSLPLDNLARLKFSRKAKTNSIFYRGNFTLSETGDTFFDARGWGKGHIFVNGHHLGRYWKIGPQMSLYCPASWLKKGVNEIIVLDTENTGNRSIKSGKEILYGN
jgi:beta-galactosidase